MERLKAILRQALGIKASRVKLQVNAAPELTASGRSTQANGVAPLSENEIRGLFDFLFPEGKALIAAGQITKGALSVPGVGKILLIAQPESPASLRLYLPPEGEKLFESDWARLSSPTIAPSPGVKAALRAIPFSPQPEAATPPAAVAQEPELPFGGGFVPPSLADDKVASVPQTAPPPQTAPVAEEPRGFIPAALEAPSPVDFPARPPVEFPARAPSIATFAQAQEPARISFAAEGPGEGMVSSGQNPIDAILADMVARRASDLHLTGGQPICFRIDGDIVRVGDTPIDELTMESYVLPTMPERNRREFAETNDTDFAYELAGVGRFRVNVFRDNNGVGAVMRHIPSTILTAEDLKLPPAILQFCTLQKGLVLVTGPTGSGKSTTLAAMIDRINKTRSLHILTIEDPIEFVHPQQLCLVNQREVHRHTGSFARALKAALREDPDIILIGEMRDLETIAIAIETAETGHLVFGTLHTTTAVSTVDRIIDQFPADRQAQIRMMLSESLKGVVSQTLLKKIGGGRVAAHEILVTNDAVSAMIREGKNHMIENHMQSQKQDGNQLLNEALLRLVKEGVVDAAEALAKAIDRQSLLDLMKRSGVRLSQDTTPPQAKRPA